MSAGFDHVQLDELKKRKIALGTSKSPSQWSIPTLTFCSARCPHGCCGGPRVHACLDGVSLRRRRHARRAREQVAANAVVSPPPVRAKLPWQDLWLHGLCESAPFFSQLR
jgi:hypothetical protein